MAFCAKCGKELPAGATFCPACGAPVEQAASGSTAAPAAPISGIDALTKDTKAQDYWIRRIIAFFVDALIVFVPLAVLFAIIAVFVAFGGLNPFALFVGGTISVLWSLIFILYFTLMESSSGASFGKRFFKLKVKSKTGGNPTIGQAFLRNLSKIYWLLLLLDVIVGLALSKGYQQKWSDQFLGTDVVSTTSEATVLKQ